MNHVKTKENIFLSKCLKNLTNRELFSILSLHMDNIIDFYVPRGSSSLIKFFVVYANFRVCELIFLWILKLFDAISVNFKYVRKLYSFKLIYFCSSGSFNHHDDDGIPELTSCAYGAGHMVLNEPNADTSNGSCNATNPRPGIGLFHRNAGTFPSMQTNNPQPQDQYEPSTHQHNLAGKECYFENRQNKWIAFWREKIIHIEASTSVKNPYRFCF